MSFAQHAIIWQVYPLGATGAPIRPETPQFQPSEHAEIVHRLPKLIPWLDYLVELGCNVLLLGPVFTSRTHGYDTLDFYQIDPRLGDDADIDELISAAQARGITVLFDGVFNHVAADSQYAELTTKKSFEGHDILVELDHSLDEVVDLVTDVMCFWLARGIAGWRLDAVYAIDPQFWAKVIFRVKQQFPDAWIFGEMIHGDYLDYVAKSGLDSITQYELWKAIWSSLKNRNFFELDWSLKRHDDFLKEFVPQTFIGNHDVTRITSQVGPDLSILAAVMLFTLGGTPSIYYGDEQGFTGIKEDRIGGDDAIRGPLPATPAELLPLGSGFTAFTSN